MSRKEQISISVILCIVGTLTSVDVFEDWLDGASMFHIIPEVCIIFLTVGIAVYLVIRLLRKRRREVDSAKRELSEVRESAKAWESKARTLSKGITDAIAAQFDQWGLTPAEQEVSFLLLKGLSIQEVAAVRETAERTVRQQAHEIYKKSGLSGRAQLSAFFLEDLFERSKP